MKSKFLYFIPVLLLAIVVVFARFSPRKKAGDEKFLVVEAVDGDTIVLANGDRVRLLGINSPEKGQYFYNESKNKLKQLLEDKEVALEKDKEDRDKYGRLLRYVFLGQVFVNSEMVRGGYAYLVGSINEKYKLELADAEGEARERGLGIWYPGNPANCLYISYFHYDASSDDNRNLGDEYIVLGNRCNFSISLAGWTIGNKRANQFVIPDFTLGAGSNVTVHSGSGKNSDADLNLKSRVAIWENSGDTFYLVDEDNTIVLIESY